MYDAGLAIQGSCCAISLQRYGKNLQKMDSDHDDLDALLAETDLRLMESQELEYIPQDTVPDGLAEETVVVPASTEAEVIAESQQENPSTTEIIQQNKPTRAKRNTTLYAQRKLLAKSSLFLDPLYHNQFQDDSVMLVGQIKECPRAANGNRYRIEWKNEGCPLPMGLEMSWLISYLPSTPDNKAKLQEAMSAYDICPSNRQPKQSAQRNKKGQQQHARNQNLQTPMAVVTTKEHNAMAASASVRTSSTISSLSQTTIASPEAVATSQRPTRSSLTVDSSSDDGSNLDEEDNIYAEGSVSENSLSDSDDEDAEETTAGTNTTEGGIAQLLQEISWNFANVTDIQDKDAPSLYIGPNGLKPRVADSFSNPFECLSVCGGLDYDLVCRLARNSNEYARKYLLPKDRNSRLQGQPFSNITVEEMYHFLGITLRISLSPIDWGGYGAYFAAGNRKVLGVEIAKTDGFARHYMTLNRYKQIRAAFHPEDRIAGNAGDKCYQLRHAINTLNQAANNSKYIGENVTFDEGGIGSRHRLNPVRQYNKDKPQKFRVDFFIMACSSTYFIHHLDVYQGANATNVGIHRAVRSLPTTQKAVLNAVLSTGMHNEVHGARHIALDNRYQCPELALVLREKFKILSSGTCRSNRRKGWNKVLLNLEKKEQRGTYKFVADENNKVICCQWVDSKVVNCVSSILSTEVGEIHRQVGSTKKPFPCPYIIIRYQKNMLGVDKSDQMRAAGGGFAAKAHYQKWYKRAYFAILDMMALNSLIAWNLSTRTTSGRSTRQSLKRHEFLWYIAQCMLDFKDKESVASNTATATDNTSGITTADSNMKGHSPMACVEANARCAVCRLDFNTERKARKNNSNSEEDARVSRQSAKFITNQLATCSKCRITTHAALPQKKRKIHNIDAFKGLTCFQIAHTVSGFELWKRSDSSSSSGKAYYPQMKHPICHQLRKLHGLQDPMKARKRKRTNSLDGLEGEEEEEEEEDSTTINSTTH
jgi:Transposase IS4